MKIEDRLDNSMILEYASCPRKFFYHYCLDLVDEARMFKAEFGSALHSALESWYTEHDPDNMDKAFVQYWLPWEGKDVTGLRSILGGLRICSDYRRNYPIDSDNFSFLSKDDIELAGAVDLGNFLFLYRTDGLIQDKKSGEFCVVDHKTTAFSGYLITKPNHQIHGYSYAINEQLTENITGAYLNIIHFLKTKVHFHRPYVAISQDYLEHEWKRDVQWYAESIKNSCKFEHFPKNTASCTNYGGCEFIQLCEHKMGTPVHASLMESCYTKKKWEPFVGARS